MRAAAGRSPFRIWLSAWFVGLLLLACGAPCTALAAPTAGTAVTAPADPCQAGKAAQTAPPCAQAACQVMGEPPARAGPPAPRLSRAQFDLSTMSLSGRLDAPPTPPPRASMS